MTDRIAKLKSAIETMHGCAAWRVGSEPVIELFKGEVAWDGAVEIFNLVGHPKAKRCFAWSFDEGGETQYVTVLGTPPVADPDQSPSVFEGEIPIFEQIGRPNGCTAWSALFVAKSLGYKTLASFQPVIKKAQQVLLALNIDITEHFNQEFSVKKGRRVKDVRMSRFACYLAAMSADVKKLPVALAHAYFARFSELCQMSLENSDPIERVFIRNEVSKHEITLSRTAKGAGVKDFALFKNAGYRGLYNMNLSELRKRKGIPEDRTPLDFMGPDELAANLFRVTQTDAKIKSGKIRGQARLEEVAEDVGKTVRKTMEEISGQRPEDLPVNEDIKRVRVTLKEGGALLRIGEPSDMKELPPPHSYLEPADEPDL